MVTFVPGRERWAQSYALSPLRPGEAVPVRFAPFPASAGGSAEPLRLRHRRKA